MIDDSLAQCGLFANPNREGMAPGTGSSRSSARTRPWAVNCRRCSGLAIRYPAPGQAAMLGGAPGQAAPRGLVGLGLPTSTFAAAVPPPSSVSCPPRGSFCSTWGPPPPSRPLAGSFADRLDTVTAELAGDIGEFAGVRAMLIRHNDYIAWAT